MNAAPLSRGCLQQSCEGCWCNSKDFLVGLSVIVLYFSQTFLWKPLRLICLSLALLLFTTAYWASPVLENRHLGIAIAIAMKPRYGRTSSATMYIGSSFSGSVTNPLHLKLSAKHQTERIYHLSRPKERLTWNAIYLFACGKLTFPGLSDTLSKSLAWSWTKRLRSPLSHLVLIWLRLTMKIAERKK